MFISLGGDISWEGGCTLPQKIFPGSIKGYSAKTISVQRLVKSFGTHKTDTDPATNK